MITVEQNFRELKMLDIDITTETTQTHSQPKTTTEQYQSFARNVYIHNDDYTPMEFVMEVLIGVFRMDVEKAEKVTMAAHFNGKALCGRYTKDVAETIAHRAMDLAQQAGHPLLAVTARV